MVTQEAFNAYREQRSALRVQEEAILTEARKTIRAWVLENTNIDIEFPASVYEYHISDQDILEESSQFISIVVDYFGDIQDHIMVPRSVVFSA